MMEYTLVRSKRKTAAIHVHESGVEVRAPMKMPKRDIDRFVASKEKWITDKLGMLRNRAKLREAFAPTYGDSVIYRGIECPISAKSSNYIGYDDGSFYMPPDLTPEQIKTACVQIYKLLAKRDLTAKTCDFAIQMNLKPSGVKINSAKTRWGSCSAKKSINFSWRLIMADDDVIDYVVVHELAHLAELNHSARFWSIVESVLPDFAERKTRLRDLNERLANENWDE